MTNLDDTTRNGLLKAQEAFAASFEAALRAAERHMGLGDLDEGDDGGDEHDALLEEAYEERFHCEICIVRNVMEKVWEPIQTYLDALERALGIAPEPVEPLRLVPPSVVD